MKIFEANGKEYKLDPNLRNTLKPHWEEILKPQKTYESKSEVYDHMPMLTKTEKILARYGISLVAKDILEAGCSFGERCYLMAKYESSWVTGIDIDEYLVEQSTDLNIWNPHDIKYIHDKVQKTRDYYKSLFPKAVTNKVEFFTTGLGQYHAIVPHDFVISFDTLEHIIDLPEAFNASYHALKHGGYIYHEYNPFFSASGGHSLCTLDFMFGHCRLSNEDFKRYVREYRPNEEKTALNFYNKNLNRYTLKDIRSMCTQAGFEIILLDGESGFSAPEATVRKELEQDILPEVKLHYPTVEVDDLYKDSIILIARKP